MRKSHFTRGTDYGGTVTVSGVLALIPVVGSVALTVVGPTPALDANPRLPSALLIVATP